MTSLNQIALLGATGKAGKYILQQLLQQGYNVKALVRKPETLSFQHHQLKVIAGNVSNYEAVEDWLKGCTAVISALGQAAGEPLIVTTATQNLIMGMQKHGIERYILLAELTLDVEGDQKSEAILAKTNWMKQNYPDAVADKQQAYELLLKTPISWTMIRLPLIKQTDEIGDLKINLNDCPGEMIGTTALAKFVVAQINDGTYAYKAPFVASI